MRKKGWLIAGIIVVFLIFIVSTIVGNYNNLVTTNENIDAKWSQVENNLQRRADLIPNLVNTVKGYAAHEQEIFNEIAAARSRLMGATGVSETAQAEGEMNNALSRLLAISEAYPTLKADENFRSLQDELSGTENRIAVARKDYNDAVQIYNNMVKRFPGKLFARNFGFSEREYFEIDEASRTVPNVQF